MLTFLPTKQFEENRKSRKGKRINRYFHDLCLRYLCEMRDGEWGVRLSSVILQQNLGEEYRGIVLKYFERVEQYCEARCFSYRMRKGYEIRGIDTEEERIMRSVARYITFDIRAYSFLRKYSRAKRLYARAVMDRAMGCTNEHELFITEHEELGGRETNVLALLPKEIRSCVRINGSETAEFDTVSSQPRIAMKLLALEELKDSESILFCDLLKRGEIYNYLAQAMNEPVKVIKKAYNAAWNNDLRRNGKGKIVATYIRKHFPAVMMKVAEFVRIHGGKQIGRQAMAIEAKCINQFRDQLKKQGVRHVFPIYDGLVVVTDQLEVVKIMMEDALKEIFVWANEMRSAALVKINTIKDHWNKFVGEQQGEPQRGKGEQSSGRKHVIEYLKPKSMLGRKSVTVAMIEAHKRRHRVADSPKCDADWNIEKDFWENVFGIKQTTAVP